MTDTEQEPEKSKSQIKREMHALQALADQLVGLPEKVLKQLPVSEALLDEVREARPLKHGAMRRQIKYIGGRLVEEPVEQIIRELENLQKPHKQDVEAFHQIEAWRDALIGGDEDLLNELVNRFADADRQHLRQLVRNAHKEKKENKPPKSARALFHYLSELQ